VNAIELLPLHEFASPVSREYGGVDLFSPEIDYAETDPAGCLGNRLLRLDCQFHRTLLEFSWILSHRCLTHRPHLLRCVIALVSVGPEEYSRFIKPDALKGASPVLNGGDEETGLCRPRLVATQLECDNFCLPHASLRQPLPQPEPTKGTGSARQWQPRTPAMAAGLADHVWTLREVLLYRVPPWPQPAEV
jgi:hypothetical protein